MKFKVEDLVVPKESEPEWEDMLPHYVEEMTSYEGDVLTVLSVELGDRGHVYRLSNEFYYHEDWLDPYKTEDEEFLDSL